MSHTNANTGRNVLQPTPRSPHLGDFDLIKQLPSTQPSNLCRSKRKRRCDQAELWETSSKNQLAKSTLRDADRDGKGRPCVCVGGGARQQKASDKRLFSSRQDEEMKNPSESVQVVSLECSLNSDSINPVLMAQSQRWAVSAAVVEEGACGVDLTVSGAAVLQKHPVQGKKWILLQPINFCSFQLMHKASGAERVVC